MTADPQAPSLQPIQKVALFLLRVVTAAWIGYGAFMKAWEFNPTLLPPPIMAVLKWVVSNTSVDAAVFFEWSLRAVIGIEVFIALAILATRWARPVAIAVLALFCAILLIAMTQAGLKDGLSAALAGSCGCFGKSGLPASVMLLVDGTLLTSALLFAPKAGPYGRLPFWIPALLGAIAVVAVPKPVVEGASTTTHDTAQHATPAVPTPAEATGVGTGWPAAPAVYEKNYFPKWQEWVGKPFRAQKLALAIERPVPVDLEKGDWLVVFSRPDCDHCQSFFREHFATARKERVLKVSIHDSLGQTLAMPCEGCETTSLYHAKAGQTGASPNYLIQTPVVLRMKDGIVTAVCSDVDKPELLKPVLGDEEASTNPAAVNTTTAKPAAVAWPGPPARLEPFYVAEFAKAVGQPLASVPFARTIAGKVPADLLSGRWIVVFYREDCDHCHDLLMTYFTGKLPVRTLAVAIPDADPASILENPCDECVKVSLAKGPNYVIGTPVVLAINDGVIECAVENVEDMAALESCLKFPKK